MAGAGAPNTGRRIRMANRSINLARSMPDQYREFTMPNFQKRSGSPTLSTEQFSLRPYELLIVEDTDDDVAVFLRALQKVEIDIDREIKPVAVASGAEAAEKILERKYDAIFLDINLPPPDGVELTKRIRGSEINRTTTVVILTGAED